MRTRATLRSAELGFFGVVVYTRVHTPRRCGAATFFLRPLPDFRPGVASFFFGAVRPLRINWLVVGMRKRSVAGAPRMALEAEPLSRRPQRLIHGHVFEPGGLRHRPVGHMPPGDVDPEL